MSWKEVTKVSQRKEFVFLVVQEGANMSELCRRFGISRKTGYKFLNRYKEEGDNGLDDRSKRPKHSPKATDSETEQLILQLRDRHSTWGGRKLKRRLENKGHNSIPSPSTITQILKRNGCICEDESQKHKAWQRFEAEKPNDLWQMDFKGYFNANDGQCHPLTILDDHSRYSLCIQACKNERAETVQHYLIAVFEKYGMPEKILVDNGSPWGNSAAQKHTRLTAWLIRLGIGVIHSRPYHPQTLGKDERFHRTLKAEVIAYCENKSIIQCQKAFDDWREVYNTERPHEALAMNTPISFYRVSNRQFIESIPEIEYSPQDVIRKVHDGGIVKYKNKEFKVSKAFKGQPVAVRPAYGDGKFQIFFCNQIIGHIDLTKF